MQQVTFSYWSGSARVVRHALSLCGGVSVVSVSCVGSFSASRCLFVIVLRPHSVASAFALGRLLAVASV